MTRGRAWEEVNILGAFDVRFVILMDHLHTEALVNVQKVVVDIGQRLILSLQRPEENRFRLEEASWHDGIGHALQHQAPCCGIRSSMWRSQEDESICRDEDGSIVLVVRRFDIVGVENSALDQDAPQAVADPDDGVSECAFALAEHGQVGDEGLGMLVDVVVAGAAIILPRVHVGVVSICENIGVCALESLGQEVRRPEAAVAGCPCLLGIAVEAVDEDDVDFGIGMSPDRAGLVAFYGEE